MYLYFVGLEIYSYLLSGLLQVFNLKVSVVLPLGIFYLPFRLSKGVTLSRSGLLMGITQSMASYVIYLYFKDIMENIPIHYPLYSLVLVQLSFSAVVNYECSFELITIGSLSYAPGFVFLFVVITFPE